MTNLIILQNILKSLTNKGDGDETSPVRNNEPSSPHKIEMMIRNMVKNRM